MDSLVSSFFTQAFRSFGSWHQQVVQAKKGCDSHFPITQVLDTFRRSLLGVHHNRVHVFFSRDCDSLTVFALGGAAEIHKAVNAGEVGLESLDGVQEALFSLSTKSSSRRAGES
jgi:hypothetical protein